MPIVPFGGGKKRRPGSAKAIFFERRIVRAAVGGFTSRQRLAFALYHCEGLTVQAIARVMRTSPQAVERILSSGTVRIARALAGERRKDALRA